MTILGGYFRELTGATIDGWNRFWFTPQDPATLGLIRIFAGAMLFYTHLIWSLDLEGFFGAGGWLAPDALTSAYGEARDLFWSHWHWVSSPAAMWTIHVMALAVFALLTVGFYTRVMSVLAWLFTVSYAHRVMPAALFGLDDINSMLAMYLMIGPAGAAFSVDSWLARRRSRAGEGAQRAADRVPAAAGKLRAEGRGQGGAHSGSQAPPGNPLPSRLRLARGTGSCAPSVTANVAIRLGTHCLRGSASRAARAAALPVSAPTLRFT